MKTILVPTDFSNNAQSAVDYAASLAQKEKAKLILLHAFHIVYPSSEIPVAMIVEEVSITQKKAVEKLKKMCTEIVKGRKIKCDFICKEGFAVDEILGTSKKLHPDLIVMGTQGASGLKEVILGSNTARVIEKATCPVIAVPAGASFKGINHILYSTDYKASDIVALKSIVALAKTFRSRLVLLHAADEEFTKEAEEGLMRNFVRSISKKIKYPRLSFTIKYGKGPERIIQDYVKTAKPDMIAMSTQRRGLLESFFGKSITQKMAYHTRVPLLAFHHKKSSVIFT